MAGGDGGGITEIIFSKRGQGWWCARDWIGCMIQKQGGSRGGRGKGEECRKKCVGHEMQ